jgi:hypothetical protein
MRNMHYEIGSKAYVLSGLKSTNLEPASCFLLMYMYFPAGPPFPICM